jgi:hypothetical protein
MSLNSINRQSALAAFTGCATAALEVAATAIPCYFLLNSEIDKALATGVMFPSYISPDARSFIDVASKVVLVGIYTLGTATKTAANLIQSSFSSCSSDPAPAHPANRPEERLNRFYPPTGRSQTIKQIAIEGLKVAAKVGVQATFLLPDVRMAGICVRIAQLAGAKLPCWSFTKEGEVLDKICEAWDGVDRIAEDRYPTPWTISKLVGTASAGTFFKWMLPIGLGISCVRQVSKLICPNAASQCGAWVQSASSWVGNKCGWSSRASEPSHEMAPLLRPVSIEVAEISE